MSPKSRTRLPRIPRTLKSFIETAAPAHELELDPLDRLYHHAACACEDCTFLLPQRWTDEMRGQMPMMFPITYYSLRRHLNSIDPKTIAAWPRGTRRTFGSRSADSALQAIIGFARDTMTAAAPIGLDALGDFIIAPKPAKVFIEACDQWMRTLETGYSLPRPGDWPLWKINHDIEEITGHLSDEVEIMRGASIVTQRTPDIAAIAQTTTDDRLPPLDPFHFHFLAYLEETYPLPQDQAAIIAGLHCGKVEAVTARKYLTSARLIENAFGMKRKGSVITSRGRSALSVGRSLRAI